MSGPVRVVASDAVEPIPLPGGSWTRMVLTDERLEGNASSLGYSVFRPGAVTAPVAHATEEVAYVLSGSGELRLDDERVPFAAGCGLHIPAGVWHAVANTGAEDVSHGVRVPASRVPADGAALTVADGTDLRVHVAWACRILAMEGYADLTLGHVSARAADDHVMYIKRKGVTLAEVTPDDVLRFEIGDDISQAAGEMHLEAVLHTEVYKRRPDVRCVVHGHPPAATAFSATQADLQFLSHDGVLFIDGISTFDAVPDLIIEPEQGSDVAEALGARSTLLLRNHGVLIAERDVPWAVLTAVTLERAVQLQSIATTLGPLRPIAPDWLERIHTSKYRDPFVQEYWHSWIRQLRRGGLADGMPDEAA